MQLTATSPADWQALQNEVAAILLECGFTAETERTVETVRGNVELDVFGSELVDGRSYSIACECKHWKTRVPKTTVHAFRTVVADLGINSGYIVSSGGFQSGAFDAIASTNIRLLTWEQFQDEFRQTWLQKYFCPTIKAELDLLFRYTEPLVPNWFLAVPEHEKDVLRGLRDKHAPFGMLLLMFTSYTRFLGSEFPTLPLRPRMAEHSEGIPDTVLDAVGYRDFLSAAMAYGKQAIAEFNEVKNRNGA